MLLDSLKDSRCWNKTFPTDLSLFTEVAEEQK
jgi:hypothetical protein